MGYCYETGQDVYEEYMPVLHGSPAMDEIPVIGKRKI